MKINQQELFYSFNSLAQFHKREFKEGAEVISSKKKSDLVQVDKHEVKSAILGVQDSLKKLQTYLSKLHQYEASLKKQEDVNILELRDLFTKYKEQNFLESIQNDPSINSLSKLIRGEIIAQEKEIFKKQVEMQNIISQYDNNNMNTEFLEKLDANVSSQLHSISKNKIQNLLD